MDLRLPTPAGELTRAEQKILDYINTNTDTFLFSSIGQLAQRLEISNATVSRFARHVGCRDFKALKSMVLEQSPGPAVKLTATLGQGERFSPQAWLERQRAYLETTIQQLSSEEFERAVEALCSARRVFLHGKNASSSMAQLLYFARQTEDEEQRSIAEKHAYAMLEYAERNQCRRKALLSYFGEDFEEPNCGGCDVCTGEIQEEDYTIEAQKALSAMVRSGCRFGRVLIMDILMGADNRRIRETGFQHLPTYGVGKDRTRRFWKYLIDALTRQGLAAIEGEEYPYLRVTETGWETLRGAPFRALRIVETRARRNRAERDGASQDMDVDDTLFQLLRAERRRLAEAAQVPPYVVFHDRALREMAAGKPASREAMLGIAGVGERKLAQYGDAFLAVIARYISEN